MHPSVVRLSHGLLVFLWLCESSEALPLYASQKLMSLVLCTDLDSAVSSLREQPLSAHEVGADWLEQDCVAIDPCRETGAGGSPTLRGTWLHANISAIATSHDDRPFIVLTETKFSLRCIPVWSGTLLTGLGSKKNTCDNVLTTTSKAPWLPPYSLGKLGGVLSLLPVGPPPLSVH